jgi:hypothetical protein
MARASLFAAGRIGDIGHDASRLLEALRSNGELSREQTVAAMTLSKIADNRYLELQARGASKEEWVGCFSEARLLRGMSVGFCGTAHEGIADAVYELTKALNEPAALIQFIESELGSTV